MIKTSDLGGLVSGKNVTLQSETQTIFRQSLVTKGDKNQKSFVSTYKNIFVEKDQPIPRNAAVDSKKQVTHIQSAIINLLSA